MVSTELPLILSMNANIGLNANFSIVSGISDVKKLGVRVCPNPSTGLFEIASKSGEACHCEILFIKEVKVRTGSFVGNADITIQKQGTYLIKIGSKRGLVSREIVVQ